MSELEYPSELVDLQRAADAAWAAVEENRRGVDAARRAETPDVPGRPAWIARPMRPWTPAEDAEHERLMGVARQAQEAVAAGLEAAGLGHGYDVVQGLKRVATESPTQP